MRLVMFAVLVTGSGVFAQPQPGPAFGSFAKSLPPINRVAMGPGHILAPPPPAHPRHSRTAIVPVPVYYGGYYSGFDAPPPAYGYGPGNGYGYDTSQQQPNYNGDPGYADPSQSPIVIINQNYRPDNVNPVVRDYSNDSSVRKYESPTHPYDQPAAQDAPATIYLIAMRDHTILPALAYWVEGDTLNYITTEGSRNRVTLDLVDREFSRQLNDERKVEFKLPAPR